MGIAQNLHLCNNKLKEVSFFVPFEDVTKCCGGTGMSDGCCKSESSFLKLQDEYQHESSSVKIPDLAILDYLPAFVEALNSFNKEHSQAFAAYSPPLIRDKQPVYLLNQVFLIYS